MPLKTLTRTSMLWISLRPFDKPISMNFKSKLFSSHPLCNNGNMKRFHYFHYSFHYIYKKTTIFINFLSGDYMNITGLQLILHSDNDFFSLLRESPWVLAGLHLGIYKQQLQHSNKTPLHYEFKLWFSYNFHVLPL